MTRSGGSLRTKIVIAVEAVIGSSPRTRATAGTTVGDRIAGEAHDEEADGGVPEPDHRPGHGQRRRSSRSSASATPKPPADSA